MISLPSEEIKLLEWHSKNSEEDGFQVVSNRKTKKKKRAWCSGQERELRVVTSHLRREITLLMREYPRLALDTTSEKRRLQNTNVSHDWSIMELQRSVQKGHV